jgi:hypothetical protein|tara:strand:- start:231 stop:422 length:192 start_codon:yes stop_codon:yes gene_type:complete
MTYLKLTIATIYLILGFNLFKLCNTTTINLMTLNDKVIATTATIFILFSLIVILQTITNLDKR